MFCCYFFSRSAVTPKHFSNYFRNFLLKNIFKASFFFVVHKLEVHLAAYEKKVFFFHHENNVGRNNNGAIFNLFQFEGTLQKLPYADKKTGEARKLSANEKFIDFRVCKFTSIILLFSAKWPVADDKQKVGVAFSVLFLLAFRRQRQS